MKVSFISVSAVLALCLCLVHCSSQSSTSSAGTTVALDRAQQGGATTTTTRTAEAFNDPAPNLSDEEAQLHEAGDEQFSRVFDAGSGLGPVFNHTSCVACHIGNGRGAAQIDASAEGSQMLVRVSLPGGGEVPGLGKQLQDHAIPTATPEVAVTLTYVEIPGTYEDGTAYRLRAPQIAISPLGDPLPDDIEISLRSAPPVFGLGLLQAIPPEVLVSLADPDDRDGDGISGRVNRVWDDLAQRTVIGRFGRKANTANLLLQAAAAYFNDMEVSNPVFMGDDLLPDIDQEILDQTTFYTASLAVPRAVDIFDPRVVRGERLFQHLQCAACHVQALLTGESRISPALSFQQIFPYTDLLLHDMGPGLADGRADFEATGTEWKTPALWGLGVTEAVLGTETNFLHDGRARTLEEAILWHGGEAGKAQEGFRTLPAEDRDALLVFLRSL